MKMLLLRALISIAWVSGAAAQEDSAQEDSGAFRNCTDADLKWVTVNGAPRVEVPAACTALNLANTRVADGTAQALAVGLAANAAQGLDQINTLRLQRNSIGDAGCSALAGYVQQAGCALEVLHLSSNDISDDGAAELAAALQRTSKTSKLRELHLANNGIETEGAVALATALRGNAALEVLVLSYNAIGADGARALAATARSGPAAGSGSSLRDLKLARCRVGNDGAVALGGALASPDCALESLDLAMNGVGDPGAVGLAVGLRVNAKLDTLLLTGHPSSLRGADTDHAGLPMGDSGAAALADALRTNPLTRLRVLDLSRGVLGDAAAHALGLVLLEDQTLEVLKLQENLIGDAGAADLARGLEGHGVLEELHLRHNNVHDEGASRLYAALRRNPQVHQLVLYDNMVSGTIMDRVRETLHSDGAARQHVATRDHALAQGALARTTADDNGAKGSAAAALAAVYDVLDGCGLAESGAFDALHAELGVEAPADLEDLDASDLHGSSLAPMARLNLVACLCGSNLAPLAGALCGAGQEL